MRFIFGGIAALILAGLAAALEMWTIVPGPTLATLILAVGIPELAPWGVVVCAAILALVQYISRGWPRIVATVFAAGALGCATVPLLFVNATIAAADDDFRRALGPDYAVAASDRQRARMSATPFSIVTSFAGYTRAAAIHEDAGFPVIARDGAHLTLDVYRSADSGLRPAVVLIYGGSWQHGSPADMAARARTYAALGYTAIAVDYRHAPAFQYPTQINDVSDALATIAHNARAWNVDRARVAVMGYSAGAQLALLAAYGPEPLAIKAVVALYAPEDLTQGYNNPPVPDPVNVRASIAHYIGGTPVQDPDAYAAASPLSHVRSGLPATLLIGGARDELVRLEFQHQMRDRLHLQGDLVISIDLPCSNHSFDELPNGLGAQIARYYTERFLAATL